MSYLRMRKTITLIFFAVLFSCKSVPKIEHGKTADHKFIFVGNSYLHGTLLNGIVDQLVSQLEENKNVHSVLITGPGYSSMDHLNDLHKESTQMHKFFIEDQGQGKKWDLILLQEQSQIPGLLNEGLNTYMPKIHTYGQKIAKNTMLLMTWAYVEGDPINKSNYPNYLEMQKRLDVGTRSIAAKMSTNLSPVIVVPAGLGYLTVYKDLVEKGIDPLSQNSQFRQLYLSDGKHPSIAGAYLTACMIASLYSQKSILQINEHPNTLDPEFAKYLREVADRVLKKEPDSKP